jgi:acyl carrier protein
MTTVAYQVQELLREHFSLTQEQTGPERLLDDLGIDSLAAIEFMFQLEDKFGVSLSEERGELRSVSDVIALVQRALAARPNPK